MTWQELLNTGKKKLQETHLPAAIEEARTVQETQGSVAIEEAKTVQKTQGSVAIEEAKTLKETHLSAAIEEARILLLWASGQSLSWLYAHLLEFCTDVACILTYQNALVRRAQHEPIAYITETVCFCGYMFYVNPAVLIPRPETEMLVAGVLEALPQRGSHVLEIGTGSGCIACAVALQDVRAQIISVDISATALAVARKNIEMHHLEKQVDCVEADFLSDGISDVFGDKYNIIVSNPPYVPHAALATLMPDVRDYEPNLALDGGTDGLDFYRKLACFGIEHLAEGGLMLIEIGYDQGVTVPQLFTASGYQAMVQKDFQGLDRVVLAERG